MDDQTKGKIKQAEGKGQEMWGDVKEKAEDVADEAKEKASATWEQVEDKTEDVLDRDKDSERTGQTPQAQPTERR
jgi:vacuolar-type H+-ATPase subunit H